MSKITLDLILIASKASNRNCGNAKARHFHWIKIRVTQVKSCLFTSGVVLKLSRQLSFQYFFSHSCYKISNSRSLVTKSTYFNSMCTIFGWLHLFVFLHIPEIILLCCGELWHHHTKRHHNSTQHNLTPKSTSFSCRLIVDSW